MQSPPRGFCYVNLLQSVKRLMQDLEVDQRSQCYVIRRYQNEGISFLTKTLPLFSKFVLRSLECGKLPPRSEFTHFRWKGALPEFLRGLLCRIFDHKGHVSSGVDALDIWRVRQLCDYFFKLSFTFSDEELKDAEEAYISCEKQLALRTYERNWIKQLRSNLRYYPVFTNTKLCNVLSECRPRFGPGSFYGSGQLECDNFALYKQLPGTQIGTCRMDQRPFLGYFRAYPSSLETTSLVEEGRCSEVLFVPKDSRGPRVISREPLHLLRMQLSFFDFAASALEKDTHGRINFYDQRVNRELAREGSITKGWATLDLEKGSDNVTFLLARKVFEGYPTLWYFITRCRSLYADLPSGGRLPLYKLAGMGSGLTFPIMAFLIHLSVSTYVQRCTGLPYKDIGSRVYVYGDDLIIPANWFNFAVVALEKSGLKVNSGKSFSRSHFRESCGGDYYNGQDVTPVRLKLTGADLPTTSRARENMLMKREAGVLQLERHCRELYKAGMISLAAYYYKELERALGPLPFVAGESHVLGRYTYNQSSIPDCELNAYVPKPVKIKSTKVCGWKHLARYLRPLREPESGTLPAYGEVAIPRRVKLRTSLVYGHSLRGVQQS